MEHRDAGPESPTTCADENFGDLNELCLQGEDVLNPTFYNPCGPGLVCFAFKPRCSITQGTCMLYCDPDNPCADPNLSCCYGVDESGNCLGPSADRRFGGCFDLRTEGRTVRRLNSRSVVRGKAASSLNKRLSPSAISGARRMPIVVRTKPVRLFKIKLVTSHSDFVVNVGSRAVFQQTANLGRLWEHCVARIAIVILGFV